MSCELILSLTSLLISTILDHNFVIYQCCNVSDAVIQKTENLNLMRLLRLSLSTFKFWKLLNSYHMLLGNCQILVFDIVKTLNDLFSYEFLKIYFGLYPCKTYEIITDASMLETDQEVHWISDLLLVEVKDCFRELRIYMPPWNYWISQ